MGGEEGGSAAILLATSEEFNSDVRMNVRMNVRATPTRLLLSRQPLNYEIKITQSTYSTVCVTCSGEHGRLLQQFVQLESELIFNHYSHTAGLKSEVINTNI